MLMWSNSERMLELSPMCIERPLKWLVLLGLGVLVLGRAVGADTAAPAANPPVTASAKPVDLFPDNLVAKGKDVAIKRSSLDDAMINIKSSAAARGQPIPPQHLELIEQQVLDRLIQIQLLLAKASDADKTAGKEATAKRMQAIKERAKSEEDLNRQLKSMGTSQSELTSKMSEELTAQIVLERELKISVNDDEVKKYYEDNPANFDQTEMVRVSHILFATKDLATGQELTEEKKTAKHKLAEDVLKRARGGEDFAKLVKEYSEDTGSKETGGEYTFARASADPQHAMVPEFESAAFALKTNEVSDLVTTQFGYHIIKLNEKIPAKKLELAKVSPDIKDYLKQQQLQSRQQEYQSYIEKLKKEADVAILDERLKPKAAPESTGLPAGHPSITPETKPPSK